MRYSKRNYIIYIAVFSSVTLLLAVFVVFGQHGLLDLHRMRKEKDRSVAIMEELKEKNNLLAAEIRRLREDRQYLESVARKELGLVKDNEIIYRFKRELGSSSQESGQRNQREQ